MGGEKGPRPGQVGPQPGSPPRGRGKVSPAFATRYAPRITPAWAGKSEGTDCARAENGDHPRVGGEKAWPSRRLIGFLGSPPRGRGKAIIARIKAVKSRITPAWAGKRRSYFPAARRRGDHPRVGGEKTPCWWRHSCTTGSPPRGRGKEDVPHGGSLLLGITPAWAGKSCRRSFPA